MNFQGDLSKERSVLDIFSTIEIDVKIDEIVPLPMFS